MALFAIADLHFAFSVDKPMDIFGENFRAVMQSVLQLLRNVAAVFIPQGMLRRCPEIHCVCANLNFRENLLRPQRRAERIADDDVVAAVAARLRICYVILLLHDGHIRAGTHHINHLLDILHELAENANACDILDFLLDMIGCDMLSACLIQNTGRGFQPARDRIDRRINA